MQKNKIEINLKMLVFYAINVVQTSKQQKESDYYKKYLK